MRVFYDSQAFDMQTHGGVSRYISEIYQNRPQGVDATIGAIETDNVYLQQLGFPCSGYTYGHFIAPGNFPMKKMLYKAFYNIRYGHPSQWDHTPKLNQYYSENILKKGNFDVFHATYFDGYFLKALGERPFVLTVHDMISELYPNFYERNHPLVTGKLLLVPKAAHIIAVSEQTKIDLMRIMHVPEERISVIYHGVDPTDYQPSEKRPYDFEYLLFVGERHFYKNFNWFCHDIVPVLKRHQELQIICTGKPFTKEEQQMFEEYGVSRQFKQTFVKTNQEFMDLYHHAAAFVYPSAYEGFGMPILEAYKADCPVVLNRASCFPEIAGDAAIYFEFNEKSSNLEEQIETLLHLNSHEREHLLIRQRERLSHYSWARSAQEHVDVYRKLS